MLHRIRGATTDETRTVPEEHLSTIEIEAAEWVARIGGGALPDAERRALNAWLARSSEHAAAFRDAQAAWADLGHLKQVAEDVPPVVETAVSDRRPNPPGHGIGMGRWATAAALVCAVGLGVLFADETRILLQADHTTGTGKIHEVALPDGSRAILNTGSAISLDYDAEHRTITLLRGEAVFAVAREDSDGRPFVVRANDVATKALGTEFLIRTRDAAIDVMVLAHRVEVRSFDDTGTDRRLVLAGNQAVRVDDLGQPGPIRSFDPAIAAAWRRGKLYFDRVPLSDAVAELNRYRNRSILILDDGLGDRLVSGLFHLDGLDTAIGTIADELGAEVLDVPPLMTVLY